MCTLITVLAAIIESLMLHYTVAYKYNNKKQLNLIKDYSYKKRMCTCACIVSVAS